MENRENTSTEGTVVLISYQGEPAMYARIESIEPDIKKGWYHVTFLLLTIPPQPVTWILREEYINGVSFTMGGMPMTIKRVEKTGKTQNNYTHQQKSKAKEDKPGKIIPFRKDS